MCTWAVKAPDGAGPGGALWASFSLCGLCTWPLQSGGFRGANEDVVLFLKKKLVYIFGFMSWILVAAWAFL